MFNFDINFNAVTGAGFINKKDGIAKTDLTNVDVPIGKVNNDNDGFYPGLNLSTGKAPTYSGPESLVNMVDYLDRLNV